MLWWAQQSDIFVIIIVQRYMCPDSVKINMELERHVHVSSSDNVNSDVHNHITEVYVLYKYMMKLSTIQVQTIAEGTLDEIYF